MKIIVHFKGYSVYDMKVIIRDHDRSKKDGEIRHSVCHKTEHHEYNSDTKDNDIAILHL